MSDLTAEKLRMRYKTIFTGSLAWGFECDSGWYPMLADMAQEMLDAGITEPKIVQIKEKFGALRVYTAYHVQELQEIIDKYEIKSETICEVCGEKGAVTTKGSWLKTLCDKHYEEWIK